MIRPWLKLAALAAVLSPIAALGGELSIRATSFPPGQELRPGVAVLLSVSGLEPDSSPLWHPPGIEGDLFIQLGDQYLFAGTAAGPRTFVVQVPAPGADPFAMITFNYGEGDDRPDPPDPPVPPLPGKVAGVLILEEQHDRTAKQARIMDDPTWQIAAKKAGLTWAIEDKDHPNAKNLRSAIKGKALPLVCLIDSDGDLIEAREFPATVEEMRALIGGLK